MTKHQFFNVRLYRDMLRQLRLVGAVLAGVCIAFTILPPLIIVADDIGNTTVNIAAVTPALWGFMYAGGAGLIYSAFSYLNHRNSADYYYSLPNTGTATYLSVLSAAATWIVGTVAGTIALAYLGYAMAGITVNTNFIPYLLGYFAIGTLQVAVVSAVACCITGTRFSGLILTALILWLPRFLTTLIGSAVLDLAKIVPAESLGLWLSPAYNIAAAPITLFAALITDGSAVNVAEGLPILYTGILTIAYGALGLWFYNLRRSEWADRSAPTRLLQHVYRSALTLPFLALIGTIAATDTRHNYLTFLSKEFSSVAVILVIAAALYFCFEAITTKKIRNLLTTLPLFLALVVVVPFGWDLISTGIGSRVRDRRVDASEIRSVSMDLSGNRDSYAATLLQSVECDDPEVFEIVARSLDATIAGLKVSDSRYYPDMQWLTTMKVAIDTGASSFTREIEFTSADHARILAILSDTEQYRSAAIARPKTDEVKSVGLRGMGNTTFERGLYQTYLGELAQYTGDELIKVCTEESGLKLAVFGTTGLSYFSDEYPLNRYTPKTINELCRTCNEQNEEIIEMLHHSATVQPDDEWYGWAEMHITVVDCGGEPGEGMTYYLNADSNGIRNQDPKWLAIREIADWCGAEPEQQDYSGQPMAHVELTYEQPFEEDNYYYGVGDLFFTLTSERAERLAELNKLFDGGNY